MKTKNIWVDHWNVSTAWKLFLFSKKEKFSISAIYYFGKKSILAEWLANAVIFPQTKIFKSSFDLHLHDHKDGEALFWHIWRESAQFGIDVLKNKDHSSLLKYLPEEYKGSGLLYLQRQMAYDQKRRLSIIRIVDWLVRERAMDRTDQIIYLDNEVCARAIADYAKHFQLQVAAHHQQPYVMLIGVRLAQLIYLYLKNWFQNIFSPLKPSDIHDRQAETKIGVFYAQGADLNKRSDIFWLPSSGINPKDVVVYFMSQKYPPTANRIEELKQLGVDWFSLVKIKDREISNDPVKTRRFIHTYKQSLTAAVKQAINILKNIHINSIIELWQAERFLWLINRVSLFETLFQACSIKIHFGLFSEDDQNLMAMHVALRKINGVDTYMHWSHHPEGQLMPAHDVYFSWGPYFRPMFEKFSHGIANLVYAGYQFDDKFEVLKSGASELKKRMEKQGIMFIISFFDNHYWEGGWFSKESLIEINKELLRKVIEKKDWGIILKPKRVKSFELGSDDEVEVLMNDLVKQGRCILLDKGELPTLAALASDVVIGFGAFSTPATETALASIPVIVYDPSCQFSHALYKERLKNVVFNDVNHLIHFIEDYALRKSIKVSDRDYNVLLTTMDPFRDSQSAQRTGKFMRDLLEALKQNKSDCEAIEFATKSFVEKYGSDKIVQFSKI